MPAKLQTLEEAFVEEIRDLYDAEKRLVKALPKMAKAANSPDLRAAFLEHLEQTKGQVGRLEQVFELMEAKPKGKPCHAMMGLIEEGQETIEDGPKSEDHVADLELIAAAQKVEHYEISGYGTCRFWALQIGNQEAASLLEETLREEETTDKNLTALAKVLYKEAMRSAPAA